MSDTPKFKTFRDLRSIPAALPNRKTASLSDTSTSPKLAKQQIKKAAPPATETSPIRDFQKVPNSVVREVLAAKTFRGKSKQVWDYLWSVSRGAVNPSRFVHKSRKEIKAGAGIGSVVTLDLAITHLQQVGLLKVNGLKGSPKGNQYEVFTPEEVEETYTTYTSTSRSSSTGNIYQKLDDLDVLVSGICSIGQVVENKGSWDTPKTLIKTNTKNDDDYARALATFAARLNVASLRLTGKPLSQSEMEKWGTLADLLVLELEKSASRTDSISSIPAFLTEILRRRIFNESPAKTSSKKIDTVGKSETGDYEIKPLDAKGREVALKQIQEFADDEFLQDFKKWYVKEDWAWLMEKIKKIN